MLLCSVCSRVGLGILAGVRLGIILSSCTLTVAPDLLALVVERGTFAHVTVAVIRAARAAVLFVHVRWTLARLAGALLRQVALIVGRPAQRPGPDQLSNTER